MAACFDTLGTWVWQVEGRHRLGGLLYSVQDLCNVVFSPSCGRFLAGFVSEDLLVLDTATGACITSLLQARYWTRRSRNHIGLHLSSLAWAGPGCHQLHITALGLTDTYATGLLFRRLQFIA